MKIYTNEDVWTAAEERFDQIYKDFDQVIVATSGGKDSTVVLELAVRAAERAGRLPVDAMFLDQEGEHTGTIEYMEHTVDRPDVNLWWYQAPFILFNSTHPDDPWIHCWEPGHKWLRPRHETSIKDNSLGTNRFYGSLDAIPKEQATEGRIAVVSGMRTEEAPSRRLMMTSNPMYRDWTFSQNGSIDKDTGKQIYQFHPIYDWTYRDIWHAIEINDWYYNNTYNKMFQVGAQPSKMRVSNLTSNESMGSLYTLHEIDGDLWERVTERLGGVHTVKHGGETYSVPKELPEAFVSWTEYRDYLLENLIENEVHREQLRKQFHDDWIYPPGVRESRTGAEIFSIMANDYYGSMLGTWDTAHRPLAKPELERKKMLEEAAAKEKEEELVQSEG